jgi:hypothetical protein
MNGGMALRDGPEKVRPPQRERKTALEATTQPFALRSRRLCGGFSKGGLGKDRQFQTRDAIAPSLQSPASSPRLRCSEVAVLVIYGSGGMTTDEGRAGRCAKPLVGFCPWRYVSRGAAPRAPIFFWAADRQRQGRSKVQVCVDIFRRNCSRQGSST